MQDVPKIVRERLRAATPAASHASVSHPDAEALTAFTEQSLPARERAVVIEHLAHCGDCRDIVALALPATEPVETATRGPASGWLSWPALRWGLVAAGVVAIASLGIIQYQKRPEKMATYSPARVDVAANESANRSADQAAYEAKDQLSLPPASSRMTKKAENLQPPPPSALADAVAANDSNNYDKKSSVREIAPRAYVPQSHGESVHGGVPALAGALPHGPRLANQYQQQQQNAVQAQAPTPAAASPFAKQQAAGDLSADMRVPALAETVEVESQSAQLEVKGRNLDSAQMKDLPAEPKPADEEYASARIGKAKPAVSAPTASGGVVAGTAPAQPNAGAIGGPMLALSAPRPRWTISSTGSLQRSFDQGITWQVVDVNATPAYSVDATSVQMSEKTSRAKSKEANKALKRDASAPIFRTVAATGADVWAGASGGALYHSPDAGNHWTRVTPTSSGAALGGDIVSLEFPDMQHGKISTSTGEVWTTSDAGQTWQKQ